MRRVLAEFSAPWSRSLRVATAASVTILLLVALAGQFTGPRQLLLWRVAMVGVPVTVLLGSLPFMVRGYVLTETHIEVRRLGWSTLLPLAGLVAVTGEPEGLRLTASLWEWWSVCDQRVVLESQARALPRVRDRSWTGGLIALSRRQEGAADATRCTAFHCAGAHAREPGERRDPGGRRFHRRPHLALVGKSTPHHHTAAVVRAQSDCAVNATASLVQSEECPRLEDLVHKHGSAWHSLAA